MLKGQGSSPEKNVQQRGSHITARKIASKQNVRLMAGTLLKAAHQTVIEKEDQIMTVLKDYKNYRYTINENGDIIHQTDGAEKIFRLIAMEDGSTENMNIKSMRLTKKRFKTYLTKLYNSKFADKIVNLFDFVNPLDLQSFNKQVEEIFIKSSQHNDSSGKHLKMIAFQLYDMN